MAIPDLTLIGERINDSVPAAKTLFDAGDLSGIQEMAREQVEGGARYIDVNVGKRGPDFMREAVQKVQEAVKVPLSIDSPDFETLKAGLEAYKSEKGGGKPLINSISALRTGIFDLVKSYPARVILLLTEMKQGEESKACKSAEEEHACAVELHRQARECGLENDDIVFDPGIAPIGADTEDRLKQTVNTLKLLKEDETFAPLHASVGLSNFTVMLPKRTPGGRPIRSSLESAFLTIAMPLGLDTIIGSVKRKYALLEGEDPALQCLQEILTLQGFETLTRLDQYCRG